MRAALCMLHAAVLALGEQISRGRTPLQAAGAGLSGLVMNQR